MPPKSKKVPEPSDRQTRSKVATSTPKPKPRYTYSEEESETEDTINSPNQTAFQSANMADHDDDTLQDEARDAQRNPVIPPGVSPDMIMFMNMMQQQMKDQEYRAEKQRKDDRQQQQAAMKLLIDQVAAISKTKPDKPKAPNSRVPSFDIEQDQKSFPQWKEKWEAYVIGNRLHTIEDDEERQERILCDLKGALTINTLKWFKHREMSEADRANPEKLIEHIEAYIKESTNPVVAVVELLTMKRYPGETADHLIARINEKLTQCDTSHITDVRDYLGLIATIVACNESLRKRMHLDKVDTFAKAMQAVKADESATTHSKLTPADSAHVNATSTYKRDQNQERQSQQNYQGHQQSQFRGQSHSSYRGRGGRGSHQRDPSHNRDQDRGRSQSRSGFDSSRSRAQSQSSSKPCYRCGKNNHDQADCWFKDKTCMNCNKIGHIAPVCRQPKQTGTSQKTSAVSNSVNGTLKSVIATNSTNWSNLEFEFESEFRSALPYKEKDKFIFENETSIKRKTLKQNSAKLQEHISKVLARNKAAISKLENAQMSKNNGAKVNSVAPRLVPLDTVEFTVEFTGKKSKPFTIQILPDTGANVTALDISHARGIPLQHTDVVLSLADGSPLSTLGTAEATLSRHGITIEETVYIVKGLAGPLLSREFQKKIGMIHPLYPHHDLRMAFTALRQYQARMNLVQPVPNTRMPVPAPRLSKIIPHNDTSVTSNQLANTGERREPPEIPYATPKSQDANPVQPKQWIRSGQGESFDQLYNEFIDLFTGECKPMKTDPYHIQVKEGTEPVNYGATRNVQLPYMQALEKELNNLVEQDVIEKINHSTPWLHPMVVVPKKGTADIRICVDFTRLNKHVIRPTNPQPTPWETVRNLPTGTGHFAVFDALKGYHQIPLDEESKDLTAFMTPFGRYRYKRLAFGLNSAGDVFTLNYGNAIDEATGGLRATEDTLIRGETLAELIQNTRKFFLACRKNGITLNLKKVQWDQSDVLFGGFLLSPKGYRPDPNLNKALSQFPTPKSATDVKSLFGLANQMCNFSDEIAELMAPLKSLLKKGTVFQWLPEYEDAFQKIRTHLSSERTLAYYSPERRTRLISDASRLFGIGFVLKQEQANGDWKPVQAGSRFLTEAESRYAMCELELLGITWACTKTAMFIEGLPRERFQIWTDHAPLVPILEKQALPDITNKRLQRLKMKLNHLTFETIWIKGTENVEADTLSRHPWTQPEPEDELDEEIQIAKANIATLYKLEEESQNHNKSAQNTDQNTKPNSNKGNMNAIHPADRNITDDRLRELKSFASEDATYNLIVQHVTKGFPNLEMEQIPEKLRPYFRVQHELTIDSDGFLCKNEQFVVPEGLIKTYLQRLHAMHQGGTKMMARARQSIWWPYITRDVNAFAKSCLPCEISKPSNAEEIILSHEPSSYPFQYLHMDIAQERGHYYLITTDQYSSYPHITPTNKTCTTTQVIEATIELMTHFSIPEIIYSDGGSQFRENSAFDDFCKTWGIRHILSSPYMPRSNGVAEAAVKQMKKIIRANISSNGVLDRASALAGLQLFRNTPRSPNGESPAVMIFGHPIRDSIPMPRDALLPIYRYQAESKWFDHNQKSLPDKDRYGPNRELPLLKPGTPVRIQDPTTKKWDLTGFIQSFGQNTREYMVKSGHKIMRRNRKFLKIITIEAERPVRQPARAPERPETPQSSNFPVSDTAVEREEPGQSSESKEKNEEQEQSKNRKIKFGQSKPILKKTPEKAKEPEPSPDKSTKKKSSDNPALARKSTRPPLTKPNNIFIPPHKHRQQKQNEESNPEPPKEPNPEPIRSKALSQEMIQAIPRPDPRIIPESIKKQFAMEHSWYQPRTPNPRSNPTQNPFFSNNERRERMGSASSPTVKSAPTNPLWDHQSSWRTPSTKQPMKKKNEKWFQDSKWTPPTNSSTTTTMTSTARPKRTARQVNYNEDD